MTNSPEFLNQKTVSLDFLSGGGEMGERIRNFNWSKTPIGPAEHWEQGLKTCIRIILTSPQPMFIWWGKDLINIYNDAYRFVLGEKHPLALGQPGNQVWKEIWNEVGGLADIVFNNNEGTYYDALLLIMNRFGYDEETYFKFSYNPIPGDKGGTAGLFCACTEETSRLINERSLKTLQELDTLAHEKTEEAIYQRAAEAIAANNKDFPFGIFYKIDEAEQKAKPISYFGISENQKVFPSFINLNKPVEGTYNFSRAYKTKEIVISDNSGRRKNLPKGAWEKEATHFIHIPFFIAGNEHPMAILSAALNPYRKFNEAYQQFAQLIADKVALEISRIKNYEQERKRAEALAELDKTKTVFFSNISHEFRTPLTLMLGTIEEAINDPDTLPRNHERLDLAHRNAMRLLKLVNSLLDFSRIESGRQHARYGLTDIASLTKNLAGNFRSIVEKAGLKFSVKADAIIRPVYIDKQMWEKIVFNLLSNAFKYTFDGGVTLRLYADKKNVILEVEDTGVGIPDTELPHMFERFHRVQNMTGRTYEGTGIGLSLTKGLVTLHGGTIQVKSKVGEGSTFVVSIPFGKSHLPAEQISNSPQEFENITSEVYIEEASSMIGMVAHKPAPSQTNGHAATVLVADDNADMRQHIESILQRHFNVVTAANGMDALQKIRTENPSLVLSDIMMPVMDGIQLLKEIKNNVQTAHIPVVLLTARAGEESKIEGYEIGADDYLIKPFSARELKARIDAQIKIKQKQEHALQNIYHLFEEVPFSVAVLKGEDLVIEFINKYNLEIWGQKKEQVIGKPLFEARPDLRKSVEAIHREIYRTRKRFVADEIAVELVKNNKKQTLYFNAIVDPMFDEKGNIVGQLATSIEITDQVLARKKVEESEAVVRKTKEQLELSIAAGKIGIWHWDVKKNVMTWSKEQREIFGVTENEFRNSAEDFFEYIIEEDREKINAASKLEFERSDNQYEFRIRRKDGETRWIQSRSKTYMDENGDPQYITGINIDITEQVEAHKKIRESEEKNRLFIEHAPAAMAMFDREMRYVSVSKLWMKQYDLTGNVIGKKHYDLFPNILQRWKEVHSRGMQGIVEKSDDDFYIKDDGTPVWLKWEVHPWYSASGEIGGIVIFTENITEWKKNQEAIRQSEERFRTMANEAPLFVWETDENLQTTYLNKTGFDYFDLDDSINMTEITWKDYIHPDDIGKVVNTRHEAAEGNESYTLEMRLKNGATGDYRWFLDRGAPRYNDQKFVGFIGTSLDIHERKETEKALEEKVKERTQELAGQNILLQKQNHLVKKILDTTVDAIGVYDTEMRILTLNQTSLNIFGRKESEVIGKKLLDVLPQMEGTKGHNDLVKAIQGETIHNKIYFSPVSNRYYENFLMPLKDDNGNIYAVLVIAHDNTELIVAAEKLKEAQQIAQIGHWDWDVNSGKLGWSDNMYNIYGVDPNNGIDYDKFISLVHPDDRASMQKNIEEAVESRAFPDFFHRIITPGGAEKIMHARGELITDANGKVIRMVGTGQDVTKQKLTEQQLITTNQKIEERNQFIEQLINSSLDLITVIDKDLRLINLNKKAQLIYKEYYKQDIIGKKITDIDPPVKGTESFDDVQQAFNGKVIIRDKVKSTLSDRYYEHNYVPLVNATGEVYAVMIISHDITESMRQMEELRKLYESDEQKTNFIAMASHELKTPITSIKGYVQLLLNAAEKEKEQTKPLPPLLVRSSLVSVDKQVKRLTRLISELLDISKIETGTLELKKEQFSLNELAIDTVEDILYTNTKHKINLHHDFRGYVNGDKDRIGQVMINFLTNAIKYSPDSDKIDVTIFRTPEGEMGFSVKDYGIGIDREEQKKIFERFYRARGKEEQTYPGFGIGLFIAKEFVHKHGGKLKVVSEKGKGSVFSFTLPINSIDQ